MAWRTEWLTELAWAVGRIRIWHRHRLLGRFDRWTRLRRPRHRSTHAGDKPPWAHAGSVFAGLAPAAVARTVRADGYFAPLSLPAAAIVALLDHARRAPCRRADRDPERFCIDEVRDGRSPLGRPVAVADVEALGDCPWIGRLAGDGVLCEVARRHLGYPPAEVMTRLYWSPDSSLSDTQRRTNGQTIDFHYDIERRNALYVYFYLTATDRESGAHVVVARSHAPKPLLLKLGSTRQAERRILGRYGKSSVVVLEGGAGFGFVEDPACFHKALPPRRGRRLILQFRYI